ncbi:MAG: ribonuclease H-like domain-containing protein [Methermicoccaceae archaeon]
MLKKTFIHIPSIGPKRERMLWRTGFETWDDVIIRQDELAGVARRIQKNLVDGASRSLMALESGEVDYFSKTMPRSEQWRCYREFEDSVAFVDIETTGLCMDWSYMTVVGVYDGKNYMEFVRDVNMDDLPDVLSQYNMIVTFNGARFDLPFISHSFPELSFEHVLHIDLLYYTRRLGMKGGLKSVEKQLGISRPEELRGMDGWEAVLLWKRYEHGNEEALDTLLDYNKEDVVNLKNIMETTYDEACRRVERGCF